MLFSYCQEVFMKNLNFFSERLKSLRKLNNLSQVELGKSIGLSKQTINDMEHGRSKTTLDRAASIADFFNVPIDFLVGNGLFAEYDNIIMAREVITDRLFEYFRDETFKDTDNSMMKEILIKSSDIGFVSYLSILIERIDFTFDEDDLPNNAVIFFK